MSRVQIWQLQHKILQNFAKPAGAINTYKYFNFVKYWATLYLELVNCNSNHVIIVNEVLYVATYISVISLALSQEYAEKCRHITRRMKTSPAERVQTSRLGLKCRAKIVCRRRTNRWGYVFCYHKKVLALSYIIVTLLAVCIKYIFTTSALNEVINSCSFSSMFYKYHSLFQTALRVLSLSD